MEWHYWSKIGESRQEQMDVGSGGMQTRGQGYVSATTGRQSAAAPVCIGLPAESNTERHVMAVAQGHHARGEQAGAFVGFVLFFPGTGQELRPVLLHELQDFDRGVIVVQYLALSRLSDQFLQGGSELFREGLHDVPLGRGRQRNPQIPLQALEAVERKATSIFQKRDDAPGRGIVLGAIPFYGGRSGEHLAA